jgi:type IV secretory pathway protease TraF
VTRVGTLITTASMATALLLTMAWRPIPRVVWNASGSVPIGLYRAHKTSKLMVNGSQARLSR